MTNGVPDDEKVVSFNDVVEWYLISPPSAKEMPHLEFAVTGFPSTRFARSGQATAAMVELGVLSGKST